MVRLGRRRGADKPSPPATAAAASSRSRRSGSRLRRPRGGGAVPVPQLRHEAHVLLVEGSLVPRLPGALLGLVQEAVAGRVGGVPAEGAADLDRRGAGLRALGALELAVPLLAADVAVVLLPEGAVDEGELAELLLLVLVLLVVEGPEELAYLLRRLAQTKQKQQQIKTS